MREEWENELIQDLVIVKSNMEPLRLQIAELQEMNFYEKEQNVRERANLQTRVMDLEADAERYSDIIKALEKKVI